MFLEFPDERRLAAFLERLRASGPELTERAVPTKTRPVLMISDLAEDERRLVLREVEGLGRAFDDSEFRSTERPAGEGG